MRTQLEQGYYHAAHAQVWGRLRPPLRKVSSTKYTLIILNDRILLGNQPYKEKGKLISQVRDLGPTAECNIS